MNSTRRRAMQGAALALLLAVCVGRAIADERSDVGRPPPPAKRADYTDEEIMLLRERLLYRVDVGLGYDYLTPHRDYGDWYEGQAAFYAKVHRAATVFASLDGALRPGGEVEHKVNDVLATVGVAAELHRCVSSTTTLLYGSNSAYLPSFGANEQFEFGIPASDNFLIGIDPGGFYTKSIYRQTSYGFFVGPVFRFYFFSLGYSFLLGRVEPGKLQTLSHTLFVGYDREGWFETDLKAEFGNGNYLTTYSPVAVVAKERFVGAQFSHRQWIGIDWGLYGQLRYAKVYNGYDAWGATLGGFFEF